jgi:excinuclease UvrABC nuclease subunit
MRRCVPDLHPDPEFPGCIYSEMKMCLAPCFKGCTDEEHSAEVARVQAYFDSAGESLVREFSAQRDAASTSLGFEEAAAIHARLEKLKPVLGQLPEAVHRLDRFSALMIQPCHLPDSVAFFRIEAGCLSAPLVFRIQPTEHAKSQSMESRVQDVLSSSLPPKTKSALETMEHLALFKRWYYRGSRLGEVFFADEAGTLPLRRVVRGIARVYRGEKPEGTSSTESLRYGEGPSH